MGSPLSYWPSGKFGEGLFDAAEGFAEEVLGGGIGEADAVVIAEGGAHDGGDIRLVEEVERHVGGVLYLLAVEALAIVGANVGEEVEGTLRETHFDAGDIAEELIDHVAAHLEDVAHVDDVLGGLGVHEHGADGGFLGNGAGSAGHLTLELVGSLGDDSGGGDEADAPAGHCKALGNAVNGDDTLLDFGELGDALVAAHEVDVLIDLVGHNEEVLMTGDDLGDTLKLFLGVEHAGGVAGGREHDELGARGDGGFELLGGDLEVVLKLGFHEDTLALGEADELLVGDPEGGGDDDLVAGIDKALHHLIEALLGTRGDDYLLGLVLQTVVAEKFGADGFAKVGVAGDGRIVGEVVVDGLLGGFLNGFGGIKVGLTDGEADDVFTLSLELTGFSGHGESLALGHIEDSIRQNFHDGYCLILRFFNVVFSEGKGIICHEVP